jgi:hypothetical protein
MCARNWWVRPVTGLRESQASCRGIDHGVIRDGVACSLLSVSGNAHEGRVLALLLGEKRRDAALPRFGHASDQRPIDLACRAGAKDLGQRGSGKARLRDKKTAGGILVEPMHQTRALSLGVAQRIEHAVEMARRSRPALHRQTHRLVEHQYVGVLVERYGIEKLASLDVGRASYFLRRTLIESQRRDAYRLPALQSLFRLRALAIHPQLAFANYPLNVGKRQPGKPSFEKAVDAHPSFVGGDNDALNSHGDSSHALSGAVFLV